MKNIQDKIDKYEGILWDLENANRLSNPADDKKKKKKIEQIKKKIASLEKKLDEGKTIRLSKRQLRRIIRETSVNDMAARIRKEEEDAHMMEKYSDIDDYFDGGYDEEEREWIVYCEVEGKFVPSGVRDPSPLGKVQAYHNVNGIKSREFKGSQIAAGMMENKMKITKRQLRKTIRNVILEMRGPEDLPYGNVTGEEPSHNTGPDGRQTEGSLRQFVDQHIDDFIDLYIRTSSAPENFWDFWEMHCKEKLGIKCTQDQLVALVDRAEEMEEVEPGELFVGERGAW